MSKVTCTTVHKATTVANHTGLCSSTILVVSRISSLPTGLKFPIWIGQLPSPCIVHDAKQNHNFSRSFYLHHTQNRACTGPGKVLEICF